MQHRKEHQHQKELRREDVDTSESLFSMRAFQSERDLPIVYTPNYNLTLWGLELMHHFDTKKYAKVAEFLNEDFLDTNWPRVREADEPLEEEDIAMSDKRASLKPRRLRYLRPKRAVSERELALHHSEEYLGLLKSNKSLVARITEIWLIKLVPASVIESRLLAPIKWQVAGTIYAAHLALQHGWALNVGGGFHQSSAARGETFCIYSDIMVAIKYIWRKHPLQNVMIIDLDAHRATGLELDFRALAPKQRKKLFLLDLYNNSIQQPDAAQETANELRVELGRYTGDETYLRKLNEALQLAFQRFKPTLVVYVAGQDPLEGDLLGLMNLSEGGLKRRDELVFQWASERNKCPLLMLLGGGYMLRGARVFADSVRNLYAKSLIWGGHRSGSRSLSRPRPSSEHEPSNSASHSSGSGHRKQGTQENFGYRPPGEQNGQPPGRKTPEAPLKAPKASTSPLARPPPAGKQLAQNLPLGPKPPGSPPAQPANRIHAGKAPEQADSPLQADEHSSRQYKLIKTLSINTPPTSTKASQQDDRRSFPAGKQANLKKTS